MSNWAKPFWYRYSVKNIVESEGPPVPPETTNAWVKVWNELMICRTTLKKMIGRSEEHTSELQSRGHLVCRLLLEKKKNLRHSMKTQNTLLISHLIVNQLRSTSFQHLYK